MFVDPDGRAYTKYEDEEGNELLNTFVGGLSAGVAGLGIRPKGSAGLKPLGLGTTGRSVPKNLAEQLSLIEIMSNPSEEKVIMNNIKDSRWSGWSKMSNKTAYGVEIHYNVLYRN